MNVIEAIQQRRSTRAFLSREVEPDKINTILDAARHAPSGANTQPWQVAVVSGETKLRLQSKIEQAFRNGDTGKADYTYYPDKWQEPYSTRRRDCGLQLYRTLGISHDDKQRRLDQWAANYRAFDAPVLLLFFIDSVMQTGSYIDYGMFLQSLMLAAIDQGLTTCPQASLADYPEIIKAELDYPEEITLLCGMALGYGDDDALVNSYRTPRETVSSFTRYYK